MARTVDTRELTVFGGRYRTGPNSWEQAPHPYRFGDNQSHWGYRTRPPLQHLVITVWKNGLQEEITVDRQASRIENGKRPASQHEELCCMILLCDRMSDQRMACAPHTSSDSGKCNNPVCIFSFHHRLYLLYYPHNVCKI